MITTLTLIVAVAALIVAYLALRRASALEQHLERSNSSLLELRSALSETQAQLGGRVTDLRLEMRQRAGEIAFTAQHDDR